MLQREILRNLGGTTSRFAIATALPYLAIGACRVVYEFAFDHSKPPQTSHASSSIASAQGRKIGVQLPLPLQV